MTPGQMVRTVKRESDPTWGPEILADRRWGVEGRIVSAEMCGADADVACRVRHLDGSYGYYTPSELARLPTWQRYKVRTRDGRHGEMIGGQSDGRRFKTRVRFADGSDDLVEQCAFDTLPNREALDRFRALPEDVQVDVIETLYQAMRGRNKLGNPIGDISDLVSGGGWTFDFLT